MGCVRAQVEKDMNRVYEIFEVWPDGSTVTRAVVSGLEFAKVTLDRLAERTSYECKVQMQEHTKL